MSPTTRNLLFIAMAFTIVASGYTLVITGPSFWNVAAIVAAVAVVILLLTQKARSK